MDARKWLKKIVIPTLLINSRNDPFFGHEDGRSLPTAEQIGEAPVKVVVTNSGGHCGFVDYDGFYRRRPLYFPRISTSFCMHVLNSLPRKE